MGELLNAFLCYLIGSYSCLIIKAVLIQHLPRLMNSFHKLSVLKTRQFYKVCVIQSLAVGTVCTKQDVLIIHLSNEFPISRVF